MATVNALVRSTLILLMLLGGTSAASAQNFGKAQETYFRIESSAGQTRSGRPAISGYVYNDYGHFAAGVQILVEEVDASGRVTTAVYDRVGGVPNFGRTYFEVPLRAAPGAYRVRVTAWEWLQSDDKH